MAIYQRLSLQIWNNWKDKSIEVDQIPQLLSKKSSFAEVLDLLSFWFENKL